jgi:sirohydrochlorin cobaltochelatase
VKSSKIAALIVGHGSRLEGFDKPMSQLAAFLRRGHKHWLIRCAYLGITPPTLAEAIDECIKKGTRSIRVLPYFLLMGNHVKSDIPRIVGQLRKKYGSRVKISLCPYLGYHEKIGEVAMERLEEPR